MCVPWELNPRPFALLTQCSTTEPQEYLWLSALLSKSQFSWNMGRNKDLSEDEKREIVQCLATGMKTIDISWKLKRDHRTVKRFVSDSQHRRIQSDKGLLRKVSVRQINVIKRAAIKKSHCWAANRYLKLLASLESQEPLDAGSFRGWQLCIKLHFDHPNPNSQRKTFAMGSELHD